jgi:hypothetical protein
MNTISKIEFRTIQNLNHLETNIYIFHTGDYSRWKYLGKERWIRFSGNNDKN